MGAVRRDHVQVRQNKYAQVLAQRHRSLFYNTGKLLHHGRDPRSCGHCEAIGHRAPQCPELHGQTDFVTAFTQTGMGLCSDQDLQWLRALPANCEERPRMLFGEQTVTLPLAPPLRKVPDGTCAVPALLSASLRTETDPAPAPQVIS
jgi:hypothetical protein